MMRLASASFLRRMTSSARSSVTVYGSSSFSEAYLLPYFTYGPKRPTLATMVSPSGVSPSVRGSLNSSIASASVIESIFCPGRSPAKRGFSSSSLVPICTNGPKRPMRTAMGLPVAGSLPSSRACATCSRVTVRSIFHLLDEGLPELVERRGPLLLAARHRIQLVLHGGGEAVLDVAMEVLGEEAMDDLADVGRHEALAVHLDVLAVLQRRDDGRVGRGPADAVRSEEHTSELQSLT